MSISSISSQFSLTSIQATSGISNTQRVSDPDGDGDGGRRGPPPGGRISNAISQALSQLGIGSSQTSATSANSGTSSSDNSSSGDTNVQQALQSFAQALFSALQSGNGNAASTNSSSAASGSSTNNNASAATAATSTQATGGHHGHHHGGAGRLESGLQNLIQQLQAGSNASGGSSAGTGSSGTSNSDALNALQQSFNQLLSAEGQSGSQVSLPQFLQTLSQNLHGAPPTGNAVSTKA